MLAQNRQQMMKLKLEDDDIDNETRDLFVIVDNPEKHVTTLESYMTFRVTTKVNNYKEFVSLLCFFYMKYMKFRKLVHLRQYLQYIDILTQYH